MPFLPSVSRQVSSHLQPALPSSILKHWNCFDFQNLKKKCLISFCTWAWLIVNCMTNKLGHWRDILILIPSCSWAFSVDIRTNGLRSHMHKPSLLCHDNPDFCQCCRIHPALLTVIQAGATGEDLNVLGKQPLKCLQKPHHLLQLVSPVYPAHLTQDLQDSLKHADYRNSHCSSPQLYPCPYKTWLVNMAPLKYSLFLYRT